MPPGWEVEKTALKTNFEGNNFFHSYRCLHWFRMNIFQFWHNLAFFPLLCSYGDPYFIVVRIHTKLLTHTSSYVYHVHLSAQTRQAVLVQFKKKRHLFDCYQGQQLFFFLSMYMSITDASGVFDGGQMCLSHCPWHNLHHSKTIYGISCTVTRLWVC